MGTRAKLVERNLGNVENFSLTVLARVLPADGGHGEAGGRLGRKAIFFLNTFLWEFDVVVSHSDCEHVRARPSVDLRGEAGGHRREALKVKAEETDV